MKNLEELKLWAASHESQSGERWNNQMAFNIRLETSYKENKVEINDLKRLQLSMLGKIVAGVFVASLVGNSVAVALATYLK